MAAERPDLNKPSGQPPEDAAAGPSGFAAVLPAATMFAFVIAIVVLALALLGGWVGFAIAVALMIAGVLIMSRYVERVAWTRRTPQRVREGMAGAERDLALTDEAHDEISVHDLPLDHPAHHELARLQRQSERRRSHARFQPR